MARLISLLLLFSHFINFGQETKVSISIKDSTITIGQSFEACIVVSRPFNSQLFCPDTNSNFYPFEFHSLKTFESKLLNDSTIKDSAIYTLASYSPFKTQDLNLTIGLLTDKDSLTIQTNTIPLQLNSYIDSLSLEMKPKSFSPFYEYKTKSYNVVLQTFGICLIIVLIIIVFIVVRKVYKQKKIKTLNTLYSQLNSNINSKKDLSDFVQKWKLFLDKTTLKNISAFTTPELKSILKNEKVVSVLTEIDNIKYNPKHELTDIDTESLINYANDCLISKIKELNEKS